jgi:deoxyribodipyrimidine photo-lyase
VHIYWMRKDFRVSDNAALYHACKGQSAIMAVYLHCPSVWKRHQLSRAQVQFTWHHLKEVKDHLAELGVSLKIIKIERWSQCASALEKCLDAHKAEALYFNKQYELDECRRDDKVVKLCDTMGIKCHAFDDQVLIAPGEVLTKSDTCYRVFTPFKNACYRYLAKYGAPTVWPKPAKRKTSVGVQTSSVPLLDDAWQYPLDKALWPIGEDAALKRLRAFCRNDVNLYHQVRDVPSLDQTSRLSAYLAIGVVSPRQCLAHLLKVQGSGFVSKLNQGARTWLDELWWRDFYKCIMWYHPRVCMHQPYQVHTNKLNWSNDKKRFNAWKSGRTGVPLVDAAMRQLNQTAWMHNRLRMVTAMFLSKNCDIDWRWGEQYFSERLIDLDLSSNNGGWQWSSSTGTDASPYFRVFNPIEQSKRFDPHGDFIRQYCPELRGLDNKAIHDPSRIDVAGYPGPIVDIKLSRLKSIAKFKKISGLAKAYK